MLFFFKICFNSLIHFYDKNVPHDQPSCSNYKLAYTSSKNSPLRKRSWSLLLGHTMSVTSSWTSFFSCQVSMNLSVPSANQPTKPETEMALGDPWKEASLAHALSFMKRKKKKALYMQIP